MTTQVINAIAITSGILAIICVGLEKKYSPKTFNSVSILILVLGFLCIALGILP